MAASAESEGSLATGLNFKSPRNVLADDSGGFYFSDFDGHRVYYVDVRGILSICAGTGSPGYGAENILAIRSALRNPAGLAFDPLGSLIIAEAGAQRFRRVSRGIISSYLSEAFRHYPLYSPTGIAFDKDSNFYVGDARTTGALKRSPQGVITELQVAGRAVAPNPKGGVYFGSGNSVFQVDPSGKTGLAAGGNALADAISEGAAADSRFLAPFGLACDSSGNIYIADERSHRVRRISTSGMVTTVAGNGKPAFAGDGAAASKASLNAPRAVAVDGAGNIYIADTGNHAVRRVDKNGIIRTIAGNGFKGFRGDGSPGASAQLNGPSGVAFDPVSGALLIADTGNHRIRLLSAAGIINTLAGNGTPGFTYDGNLATLASLNAPTGVAVDAMGNLYVADTGNNRIRMVDPAGSIHSISDSNLTAPTAIALSREGGVYVADSGANRVVTLVNGDPLPVAGTGQPGFHGDGGPALEAEFQTPSGLAFDLLGNLIVADTGNYRIRRLTIEAAVGIIGDTPVRMVNAASSLESPLVPGMLATLYAENIAPAASCIEVRIGNIRSELLYVSPKQINLRVPNDIVGLPEAKVEILCSGLPTASFVSPVAAAAPALFPAAVNEDGAYNSLTNPAARGSVIQLFGTGQGTVPMALTAVHLGSTTAEVLYAGPAPGLPGVFQVNVRIPTDFYAAGSQSILLRVGPHTAPDGVRIVVQ